MSDNIPVHLQCPITRKIMAEPVVAEDGITYEHEAIEEVYRRLKQDGKRVTSPATRAEMLTGILIPNQTIKTLCIEYLEAHPEVGGNEDDYYLPNSRCSALFEAISRNANDTVTLAMLDKDPRLLTCKLPNGDYSPFHLACKRSNQELARAILHRLMARKQVSAVAKMKPRELSISDCSWVLLHILLGINGGAFSVAEAEAAVTLGADVYLVSPFGNETLLHWTCHVNGNIASAEWLLSKGLSIATCNAEGQNALLLAVNAGCIPMIRLFLQSITDATKKKEIIFAPDAKGCSPISELLNVSNYAADQRRELLPLFLENVALASLPAIHVGVRLDDGTILEKILQQETAMALMEEQDADGFTPLLYVSNMNPATEHSVTFAKLLLTYKAESNARVHNTGESCLHLAVKQHSVAMLELLLSNPVVRCTLVNSQDKQGNTPIHTLAKATVGAIGDESKGKCARETFVSCMCRLIENGAAIWQANHQGLSPSKTLKEAGLPHLASLIKQIESEFTQKQIGALKDEVRKLRAKVEANDLQAAAAQPQAKLTSEIRFDASEVLRLQERAVKA